MRSQQAGRADPGGLFDSHANFLTWTPHQLQPKSGANLIFDFVHQDCGALLVPPRGVFPVILWCFGEKLLPLTGGEPVEDHLGRIVNDVASYKRVLYAFRPFLRRRLRYSCSPISVSTKGASHSGVTGFTSALAIRSFLCCRYVIPKAMRFLRTGRVVRMDGASAPKGNFPD